MFQVKKLNNSKAKYLRFAQLTCKGWAKFMDFCSAWQNGDLEGSKVKNGTIKALTIHTLGVLYHKEEHVILSRLKSVLDDRKSISVLVSAYIIMCKSDRQSIPTETIRYLIINTYMHLRSIIYLLF